MGKRLLISFPFFYYERKDISGMTLSNMYQAQIQQNYNLAIGYYKQRREMITELYLQKII